jgi:hypothetical protein
MRVLITGDAGFIGSHLRSRPKVFISYSHEDKSLIEDFVSQLRVVVKNSEIDFWWDQDLEVGSPWRSEIGKAIDESTLALAMVSPGFLTSPIISEYELPRIFGREAYGLRLMPIYLRPCAWQVCSWLCERQIYMTKGRAIGVGTEEEIGIQFATLALKVLDWLSPEPDPDGDTPVQLPRPSVSDHDSDAPQAAKILLGKDRFGWKDFALEEQAYYWLQEIIPGIGRLRHNSASNGDKRLQPGIFIGHGAPIEHWQWGTWAEERDVRFDILGDGFIASTGPTLSEVALLCDPLHGEVVGYLPEHRGSQAKFPTFFDLGGHDLLVDGHTRLHRPGVNGNCTWCAAMQAPQIKDWLMQKDTVRPFPAWTTGDAAFLGTKPSPIPWAEARSAGNPHGLSRETESVILSIPSKEQVLCEGNAQRPATRPCRRFFPDQDFSLDRYVPASPVCRLLLRGGDLRESQLPDGALQLDRKWTCPRDSHVATWGPHGVLAKVTSNLSELYPDTRGLFAGRAIPELTRSAWVSLWKVQDGNIGAPVP